MPIISQQWQLTVFQEGLALTIITMAIPLGSILQCYSDNYGRLPFALLTAVISFVFGIASVFSWNIISFVAIRFLYEISLGISLPFSTTYVA